MRTFEYPFIAFYSFIYPVFSLVDIPSTYLLTAYFQYFPIAQKFVVQTVSCFGLSEKAQRTSFISGDDIR